MSERFTQAQVEAHNAKVAKREYSKPTIRQMDGENGLQAAKSLIGALLVKKIAPKKRELLNKTETLWLAELQRRGHQIILAQAITFNIGDRMTYRPDFVVVSICLDQTLRLTAYETKGPHRFKAQGIIKLKSAARQYPYIKWVLIERDGSKWTEKEILSQ